MKPPNLDSDLADVFQDVYLDKLTTNLLRLRPPKRFLAKWLDNLRRIAVLLVLADDEDIAIILSRIKLAQSQASPAKQAPSIQDQESVF